MAERGARERLVDLLDREVFRPIVQASPDRFSGNDRRKYDEVRDATERTREKYRKEYSSARQVYDMYRSDLSSEPAQRISRRSHDLNLPAFEDVEEEFTRLAEEVGVRSSSNR